MKKTLVVVAFLSAVVFAQSRDDFFDSSTLAVTEVVLIPRPDGGCAARACGTVDSVDGGAQLGACIDLVELKATVQVNRCNGLADALGKRVAKSLRFDVDAGAL